ncbi:hypothetical protein SIN8267_00360 [Sinobacterium norvegicum]|uniref:Luciferase-like domain-containing protein n=1 Tax=Sinobacterium norvegicum TaxID=1641715 RepID=A0ABM9AAP3_9GAMM|nr:TIGR03619 family F420-dependent LLM class oxidoreductase [Sinobacterium norvegicum]CAH0990268.1 hypothetical protein SIN8267_00360 [Sinobacterium norvegicum]
MKFVLSTSFNKIDEIKQLAVAAEQAGFGSISFSDHVVNPEQLSTPYPYTDDGARRWPEFTEWPDIWVMIGALSSITSTLRFSQNIFVLPERNPFLVAKAISTAAVLSDNRVDLSVGVGWSADEFKLLQQDFKTRGRRTDEMIAVMRKLWTGEYVEHHGEHYQFDRVEMNPAPTEAIPLWIGGISTAALKRVARLDAGWLTDLQSSAEIIDSIDQIHQFRAQQGLSGPFRVMATPNDAYEPNGYGRLADKGVSHILTQPWMMYFGPDATIEQKIESLFKFADDVIQPMS